MQIGIALFAKPVPNSPQCSMNLPMNIQLDDLATFLRIAELGTLSAVARERNVPVSQVTRALARLEATCGVRLLHRSTHGLSLTDAGDTMRLHGKGLMSTAAELAADISGKLMGPSGWVRVAVSALLAECVIAASSVGLYERYPGIHLDILADDRMADMARDGIDIAIRTRSPHGDTLVARQIGEHSRSLYAAPSYIARHGAPQHPDALASHHLISNSASNTLNRWNARPEQGDKYLQVRGHTRTDNTAVMLSLALYGVGIAQLNDLMVAPLVREGRLLQVLPQYFGTPRIPIFAVMLQERHRLPKIRACIDYWTEWIAQMA